MTRSLVSNALRVYAVQALSGVLGVLFVPIALRRFGADGYALWAVYGVLQSYIVLAELGLGKFLVQQLAAAQTVERRVELLRLGAGAYAAVSGVLLLGVPFLLWFVGPVFSVPDALRGTARWIALLAVLDYLLGLPISLKQSATVAAQDFSRFSAFAGLNSVARFGIPVTAVLLGASPLMAVIATVCRRLPEWVLGQRLLSSLPTGLWPPRLGGRALRDVVRSTLWLSGAQLLQISMVSISGLLVGWLGSFGALGGFRAMFDLVSKIWFVSSGLGLVLYPYFSRAAGSSRGPSIFAPVLPNALRASWVAYWMLGIVGVLAGGAIAAYLHVIPAPANRAFALLVLGMVCNAHANVAYEFLQAAQQLRTTLLLNAIGISVLVLATAFLPVTSVVERAAWGWALSQLVYATCVDAVAMRVAGSARDWLPHRLAVAGVGSLCAASLFVPFGWMLALGGVLCAAWLVADAVRAGRASWVALGQLS